MKKKVVTLFPSITERRVKQRHILCLNTVNCVFIETISIYFQVFYAQQQPTSVCRLPAAMVPHVWTTWETTCACVPKVRCGTWAKTAMSFMMLVFWDRATTVPASSGPTSSPATAQMASLASIAPRT